MSFSKQIPYEYAVKELDYWKSKVQSQNTGRSPDPWNDSPSRFRSDYDSPHDDMHWQNDRMNAGSRNERLSPYGSSNYKLSSSNQVNTSLFGNFALPGSNRMNTSSPFSRVGQPRFPYQTGRIERNQISEYTRQRRILQKRALNSLGNNTTNVPAAKRKRGPRVKKTPTKPAETNKSETPKTDDKKGENEKPAGTGSFSKVDPELRIAVNWVNDTKTNINKEQAALITAKFEEILDQLPDDAPHVPKFYASGLSVGVYKFVCADKESMEWVKEAVAGFPELWEGANLTIIEQSEISSLVLVSLFLIDNDADVIVLLKRFEKQNPDLKTDKWRVHHEGKDGKERVIVFGIDRESFDLLKKNELRLFLGLRRVKFALGVTKSK